MNIKPIPVLKKPKKRFSYIWIIYEVCSTLNKVLVVPMIQVILSKPKELKCCKKYLFMNNQDFFDHQIYHIDFQKRFNFILQIWNKGLFETELLEKLGNSNTLELQTLVKEFFELQYVTIEKRANVNASNRLENYYFVSKQNLHNILSHFCELTGVDLPDKVLENIYEDKNSFDNKKISEIQDEIKNGFELKNKILNFLLVRSISLFFLYIIENGENFKSSSSCKEFFNNFMFDMLMSKVINNIAVSTNQDEQNKQTSKSVQNEKQKIDPEMEERKQMVLIWSMN